MGKLTLWKKKTEITIHEETTPAADRNFDDAMQALQVASGHIEHRIIPMRCAKTMKPYALIYKRGPNDKLFKLERIATDAPQKSKKAGILAKHFNGESAGRVPYDYGDFDTTGRECPWCGDNRTTINCGSCDMTYCGGTLTKHADGSRTYICAPDCLSTGKKLSDTYEVKGKNGKPLTENGRQANLKAHSNKQLLSKLDVKLLPKQ